MKPEKTWNDAMDSLCQIMLNEWSKEEIIEYIRSRDGYTKNDMTAIIPTVTVTDAPMVDYAPVVRCKDCKWFAEFTSNGKTMGFGSCNNPQNIMSKCPRTDWFCADGERKEQDDESNT